MLKPDDRQLLLESMRPPDGFRLDYAIGTTYSLDLVALLAILLPFTFSDWETNNGELNMDRLMLLQAIKRNADRLAIFCNAGQIKVPPSMQKLMAFLEPCVHQVVISAGSFHPKVWVNRYESVDSETEVFYRVICSSRNITFDHSWDTMLVLEGRCRTDRQVGYSLNSPLGDFVNALAELPQLSNEQLSESTKHHIATIQKEIRKVEFEPPENLDLVGFHPFGIPGYSRSKIPISRDRFLVVAPFVDDKTLKYFTPKDGKGILVSLSESLNDIDENTIKRFERVLVMNPAADRPSEDTSDADSGTEANEDDSLSGLHAKLFIEDDGHNAQLWIGSANATTAAFNRNVEFMVQLSGRKKQAGIDAILDTGASSLQSLLQPYRRERISDEEIWQKELDRRLFNLKQKLCDANLAAAVEAMPDGLYMMTLRWESFSLEEDASISCRPSTLSKAYAHKFVADSEEGTLVIQGISEDLLTCFLVFSIKILVGGNQGETSFALKLPVTGIPESRLDKIFVKMVADKSDFMHYLTVMLSISDLGLGTGASLEHLLRSGSASVTGWSGTPLFETLLRSLDQNPSQIDEIASFLETLSRSKTEQDILPEEFLTIWNPIWSAREGFRKVATK